MSGPNGTADTAQRVADRLRSRLPGPWEVFGERLRRFEIHLNRSTIELARGPIELEGYGVRVFRPGPERLRMGFAAASGTESGDVDAVGERAESSAVVSLAPAKSISLPGASEGRPPAVENVDQGLWEHPEASVRDFVRALLDATGRWPDVSLSFGSVRITLAETSLANSEGLDQRFHHTLADLEVALKASGGPEGPPPGEYWVTRRTRRLDSGGLSREAETWATRARDARRAKSPPSGTHPVVFPASVLSEFVPQIAGFRFSSAAKLRGMTPAPGTPVASESVTLWDDGTHPYGLGTAPLDDEGIASGRVRLVEKGKAGSILCDLLNSEPAGMSSTGNGRRDDLDFLPWAHFTRTPSPTARTVVLEPGDGGTDAEIAETAGDGIWVDQIGHTFPDEISASFGGEIRLGYRIRGGKLAEPVRGGTVGGLLIASPGTPSVLGSVTAIGSSASLSGYLSTPSLLIAGMVVSGAS